MMYRCCNMINNITYTACEKCIGVQMYGCPGVQVYVCTGMFNYIGVQVLIGAQM